MKDENQLSFDRFIYRYPRYKKFINNEVARDIYELLALPDNIYKMILVSEENKPALSACIENIENLYLTNSKFDLNEDFCRQAVGTMVKSIMEVFGFKPIKQKIVPKSKVFRTAAVYLLTDAPILKLVTTYSIQKA